MDDYAVAYERPRIQRHARKQPRMLSDMRALTQKAERTDFRAFFYFNVFFDHRIGADCYPAP